MTPAPEPAVHTQTLTGTVSDRLSNERTAENVPETEHYPTTLNGLSKKERKPSCHSSENGMTFKKKRLDKFTEILGVLAKAALSCT